MKEHMELCSKQQSVMLNKYILDFRFFKVDTFCFDDSFAHSWHSLDQIHELKCKTYSGLFNTYLFTT